MFTCSSPSIGSIAKLNRSLRSVAGSVREVGLWQLPGARHREAALRSMLARTACP
jgi:hypothetical protein